MKHIHAATILIFTILAGCASPQGVRNTYPSGEFPSTKPPQELTNCIDRNVDGKHFNSLATSVKPTGVENFEILVRNGKSAYALIEIAPFNTGNSKAIIRLSGTAGITPKTVIGQMTKGCS